MPSPAGERGSASVYVLAACSLMTVVLLLVAALGGAAVSRHRVEAAADLTALAGAWRLVDGPAEACRRAAQTAAANGARLLSCDVISDGAQLLVHLQGPPLRLGLPVRLPAPTAWARAG